MACHCRKVCHPLVGRSIACISIYAEPFFSELLMRLPKARIFIDRNLLAAFIDPDYLDVLEAVAKRYFGAGIFWDETAVSSLPGWNRVHDWWCPPAEPPPPSPSPEAAPPRPKPRRPDRPAELLSALETLGVSPNADKAAARKAYRKGCLSRHPDRGGSIEKMVSWNAAWEIVDKML